ncbi:MAG: hypothetical protein V7703_14410, partial [Hyphomicrobiales bacterium]
RFRPFWPRLPEISQRKYLKLGVSNYIKYAEIIGDDTHKRFVDAQNLQNNLKTLSANVEQQAHLRKAQLTKLQGQRSS